MKVLNVIWAFGTGGIGKLFLTYAALGEYDLELQISSVCIDLQNCEYDRKPLTEAGIRVIATHSYFYLDLNKYISFYNTIISNLVIFA